MRTAPLLLLAVLCGCERPGATPDYAAMEAASDEAAWRLERLKEPVGRHVVAGFDPGVGVTQVFVLDTATGQVCRAVFVHDAKTPRDFKDCIDD